MNTLTGSLLIGLGHYAPPQRITNAQMEAWLSLESGWIARRTGIQARRWAAREETLADMAEQASLAALKQANIPQQEIAFTILSTSTPDRLLPPTAPLLAHRLGLSQAGAFDLAGACTGFLYALTIADSIVRTQKKSVLVVAANILSRRINLAEPTSAVLFADAAGAVIIHPTSDSTKGVLASKFVSAGNDYELISIRAGGSEEPFSTDTPFSHCKMHLHDGQRIFTQAIKMMTECAHQTLQDVPLESSQVDRLIAHQANGRIIKKIADNLSISPERTVSTIQEYGNSSAASIPLSLSLSHQSNPLRDGEKILLTAAGAGMTGGAMLLSV